MSRTRKNGRRAMRIAMYILLVTWILLLALLVAIYMLRLQGYDTFKEWMNRNQTQEVLQPDVPTLPPTQAPTPETPRQTQAPLPTMTPTPTPTPLPTSTPTPSPTLTPTPGPTATPVPTEPPVRTMVFSGNEMVDRELRWHAEELFGIEDEVCYAGYETGVFYSNVFQKDGVIYPSVYNLLTGKQVTGSDLMKETYFAVVKERLQTYVADKFPEEAGDEFISYNQVYEAEDYQKFYLTEDKVVFCFDAGTLTQNHPAFTYSTELSEAEAFFKTKLDGTANTPYIRELDPNAKMIAITFDDGPHPKVEEYILELFEKYNGRATFFFLGHRIDEWYPKSPAEVYAAGHEVASHTYSHSLNFASAGAKDIWQEINKTNLTIAKGTGYAPDYVRFPGGSFGKRSIKVPMIKVNWNMDSVDYKEKNKKDGADIIFNRLKNSSKLGDGSIVLMHSIYENSYEGIALFVEYLVNQGYELVTLSELFYYKGLEPDYGEVYLDGLGTTAKK